MASGDTKLSICSDSLIMLGAAPLSSFSEGTDAAQVCDRLYDDILETILAMYPWTFSYKKVQLARLTDTPVNEWKYNYQLPSDSIGSGVRALFTTESAGARPVNDGWEILEDKLLTDYETVYVDYQFRPSEAVLPTYFIQLIKYWMAWHIAEPVTDQITKGEYYKTLAVGAPSENNRGGAFRQAAIINGQNQPNQVIEDFDLISVRY
tara:strand:- start:5047 stop:5667 length:621 start_codon:yes stop_codon:yes gene_type:complete